MPCPCWLLCFQFIQSSFQGHPIVCLVVGHQSVIAYIFIELFFQSCSYSEPQFSWSNQHCAFTIEIAHQARSCSRENHICWRKCKRCKFQSLKISIVLIVVQCLPFPSCRTFTNTCMFLFVYPFSLLQNLTGLYQLQLHHFRFIKMRYCLM